MHTKIILPGSWDFGESQIELVKVSSQGLIGNDLRTFMKRAAVDFRMKLKQLKLAEDEIPVHVIAIGATDFYGCFAAGTPVAMADGYYRAVEDLFEGDLVLTADGNVQPIAATFRRFATTTTIVTVCGLADELRCSDDHPFRVARKEQFVCDCDKYKRCLPPLVGKQNICNRTSTARACVLEETKIETEWGRADSLREGDFLVWTAPQVPVVREFSADEGYLLGAWLAEGSFQRSYPSKTVTSIRLSTHISETEFHARVSAAATALGLTCRQYPSDNQARDDNTMTLAVSGDPARFRQWHEFFGSTVSRKKLPPWVCCLPEETRLAIIAGFIDGDGHCEVSDKENRTTARSHGDSLSLGLQRLCWSVGFPAVRCRVGDGSRFNLSIANSYLEPLKPYSWKFKSRELKQTSKIHGFYHEGRMYLPVRAVLAAPGAEVFNFEVEGDHTYSGPNVDSHNCNRNGDGFKEATCRDYHDTFVKHGHVFQNHKNKDPKKSYGLVKASAYNPDMHRIELLLAVNASKKAAERNGGLFDEDLVERLHKQADHGVSMACSIDYDVCQNCFNKAATRAEYCDDHNCVSPNGIKRAGCRHGLTKVYDDGYVSHVDNPHPRFFDISFVRKPADRTAYGGVADYLTTDK